MMIEKKVKTIIRSKFIEFFFCLRNILFLAIEELASEIESDLDLLGCTAIEDALQEYVIEIFISVSKI